MNAVILCGGLSTRLGTITEHIPKVLLEIGGVTILDWQLSRLQALGITEVVLAAGHLSHVLYKEIGEERNGVRLIYAIEQHKLGTGGAIKHALTYVQHQEDPTFVLNGDILTTIDFADMMHQVTPDSDGLILGTKVDDASTYGTLEYDEHHQLRSFKEKEGICTPGYINGGVYIFTRHIHSYFPKEDAFSIEYDVFPRIKKLYVYLSDLPWIDVGVPERLEFARSSWKTFLT